MCFVVIYCVVICNIDGIPSSGDWADVVSPARLDLCGGWSDTPPVTFEHGGKVVNVAVRINGGFPLGASARAFQRDHATSPVLIFRSTQTARVKGQGEEKKDDNLIECRSLNELSDYCDPLAPAALVKCVLLAMGIVDLSSTVPLSDQVHAVPSIHVLL
jgi:fucokinase